MLGCERDFQVQAAELHLFLEGCCVDLDETMKIDCGDF